MNFRELTRALRHRNYRLFFGGQSISLIGSWLTRVATSWLVYRLSKSALTLGVVGFVGQIPTFLFAPLAGVLIDRMNRHRVLVITQVAAMLQSALLAFLALKGVITIPLILILSVCQGIINSFDMPARQSFVVDMIEDRRDLPNAIALNSTIVNMARLVGPACAGALIAGFGEGGCFLIDAISYIAVVVSLLLMHLKPRAIKKPTQRLWGEMTEGFRYVGSSYPIRAILTLLAVLSLMGMPSMILLPVIVTDRLHGGPGLLGYLTAASGLGALVGVIYLASRKNVLGLGRIIFGSMLVFGISVVAFAASTNIFLSGFFIFFTGMGMIVQMASSNTILQTIVEEDKRGRVMSLFAVAIVGMTPFGSLLAGALADWIGTPWTLAVCGIVCVVAGLIFLRRLPKIREAIRPIYRKLGILPEIPAVISIVPT